MLTLSDAAKLEKNKLSGDGVWIVLLEFQFSGATYRICKNTENVNWNSEEWVAFPFELGELSETVKGSVPTIQIKVSNVNRIMQSYAEQSGGAIGTQVILRVVHSKYLSNTVPEIEEKFVITSVDADNLWVYINLSILNPIKMTFPRPKYLRNFCRFKFKGSRCGYTGTDTSCNHTLEDCEAKGNSKNFGGFPGIPLGGIYK